MRVQYEAPAILVLGDVAAITLGGEVIALPDAITHRRFFRP